MLLNTSATLPHTCGAASAGVAWTRSRKPEAGCSPASPSDQVSPISPSWSMVGSLAKLAASVLKAAGVDQHRTAARQRQHGPRALGQRRCAGAAEHLRRHRHAPRQRLFVRLVLAELTLG